MKEKYRRCNLGCGVVYRNGSREASPEAFTVRVDLNEEANPDFRCDVRVLPTEWKESFDEVRANHILEHIRWEETDETLEEWIRILKPGGLLKLGLPDLKSVAERILKHPEMTPLMLGAIYGDQRSKFYTAQQDIGVHLTGFTPVDIAARLDKLGMEKIEVTSYGKGMMGVEARKPKVSAKKKAKVPKRRPTVKAAAQRGGDGVTPDAGEKVEALLA
jgi:SAM-dependent methyltransferase